MPKRFLRAAATILKAEDANDILDTLHSIAAPLRMGAMFYLPMTGEPVLLTDIYYHRSAPVEVQKKSYELYTKNGLSLITQHARLDPLPFTFSEAMRELRPSGRDRELFDILRRCGIRDGFYCPQGSWMVVYWSSNVLKGEYALGDDTRVALNACADVAAYRMKELRLLQQIARKGRRKSLGSSPLSRQQIQIFGHLSQGLSTAKIAELLAVHESTVKEQIVRARKKLGAKNQLQAVFMAGQRRLI